MCVDNMTKIECPRCHSDSIVERKVYAPPVQPPVEKLDSYVERQKEYYKTNLDSLYTFSSECAFIGTGLKVYQLVYECTNCHYTRVVDIP